MPANASAAPMQAQAAARPASRAGGWCNHGRPTPAGLRPLRPGNYAELVPMFNDLSIGKLEEMEVFESNSLARRWDPKEFAALCRCPRVPHGHVVTFGNNVLNRCPQIRKRRADGFHKLAKALRPALLVGNLLMTTINKVRCKNLIHGVEISLIE